METKLPLHLHPGILLFLLPIANSKRTHLRFITTQLTSKVALRLLNLLLPSAK